LQNKITKRIQKGYRFATQLHIMPLEKKVNMAGMGKANSEMPMAHLDICDRFKLVRLESGLTQKEFAEKLTLTESYIKQIEIRSFTPNIFALKQLHRHFKVNYTWLLDGEGPRK
jgi:ribosome-binding protein aMBF1 (putative translation factor)